MSSFLIWDQSWLCLGCETGEHYTLLYVYPIHTCMSYIDTKLKKCCNEHSCSCIFADIPFFSLLTKFLEVGLPNQMV